MSLPPQVITIKRKRDDEAPVTFLQLDGEAKRHRSDSNWVYRRRAAVPLSPTVPSPQETRPVIHVAGDGHTSNKKRSEDVPTEKERSPERLVTRETAPKDGQATRRFHISRAMLKKQAVSNSAQAGVSKKSRSGPALFVERTRKKIAPKPAKDRRVVSSATADPARYHTPTPESDVAEQGQTTKVLKKPGSTSRIRANKDAPARAPLPASLMKHHEEDMNKIADDMNRWVIEEIGANLESIEQERRQTQTSNFRPKAPPQRYRDRNSQLGPTPTIVEPGSPSTAMDMDTSVMSDATDDDGDDDEWIIEEYIRIPLKAMAQDVLPSDVGILVLDGEDATALFYGPENDSDDDFGEDDEDENAENHYTADYPEDEVDSEDEYGRQAYHYRTKNASDDEEFDNNEAYESSDDMALDRDGDDDAAMARIKAYMKRHNARG